MIRFNILAAAIALPLISSATALADMAVSFSSADSSTKTDGVGGSGGGQDADHVGFSFTPSQNLTLTSLGYFQAASTGGFLHNVRIFTGNWDAANSNYDLYSTSLPVVASANVPAGAPGTYVWQTPDQGTVTLLAGTTYTLSADANSLSTATDANTNIPVTFTGLSLDSDIGYIQGSSGANNLFFGNTNTAEPLNTLESYNAANTPAFSSGPGGVFDPTYQGLFAGNFQFTTAEAPEPATLSVLGFAATAMLLRRKK